MFDYATVTVISLSGVLNMTQCHIRAGTSATLSCYTISDLDVYLVGKLTSIDTFCGKYFYYRTLHTNELYIIDQTQGPADSKQTCPGKG